MFWDHPVTVLAGLAIIAVIATLFLGYGPK